MHRSALLILAFTLGLGASWAVAQAPAPSIPDWVGKYAANVDQARRACEVSLAQEQDKAEKLAKEVSDMKVAAAKAAPTPVPPKSPPKP